MTDKEEGEVEAQVYTLAEVCKMLRVSRHTLRRWQNAGRFPAQISRGLFLKIDVAKWMKLGASWSTGEHPGASSDSASKQAG